jgi:hypothetical protein
MRLLKIVAVALSFSVGFPATFLGVVLADEVARQRFQRDAVPLLRKAAVERAGVAYPQMIRFVANATTFKDGLPANELHTIGEFILFDAKRGLVKTTRTVKGRSQTTLVLFNESYIAEIEQTEDGKKHSLMRIVPRISADAAPLQATVDRFVSSYPYVGGIHPISQILTDESWLDDVELIDNTNFKAVFRPTPDSNAALGFPEEIELVFESEQHWRVTQASELQDSMRVTTDYTYGGQNSLSDRQMMSQVTKYVDVHGELILQSRWNIIESRRSTAPTKKDACYVSYYGFIEPPKFKKGGRLWIWLIGIACVLLLWRTIVVRNARTQNA